MESSSSIVICLVHFLVLRCDGSPLPVSYQPSQIHLSMGRSMGSLVLTWSTQNRTDESIVLVQTNKGDKEYRGRSQKFVDGGKEKRVQWIHNVEMEDLESGINHFYRVGSNKGWSDMLELKAPPRGHDWQPRIALFGDMGTDNAASLPHLQRAADGGDLDAIVHVGDMAYDMYEDEGRRGDLFMRQVEPVASMLPYMTCPGNHEWHYNFSNYRARFGNSMPGREEDMFFSFDVGPVHFVSVSTEFYYYLNFGISQVVRQYKWLEDDLSKVDRSLTPWVVIYGHRPMYCTNDDRDDCTKFETRTRIGLPVLNWWGMEDLLAKYGVDLAFWAHEHSYERLFPVFNRTIVMSPDPDEPYTDPKAPVHITTGSAGCREKHDGFIPNPPRWSAVRSSQYGFTRMMVANATHIHLEQVDVETEGLPVVDSFWLVQHNHGPFTNLL